MISQIQTHPGDLQKLIDTTGFDPRKDVAEVLMASDGKTANGPGGLVLARGNFDPPRAQAAALAKGATIQNYLGTDLIVGNNPKGSASNESQPGTVAFLDNTLAVAGNMDAVMSVIAHRTSSITQLPQTLLAQVNSLSASYDAWFVSLVPGSTLMPQAMGSSPNAPASSNNSSPQAGAPLLQLSSRAEESTSAIRSRYRSRR